MDPVARRLYLLEYARRNSIAVPRGRSFAPRKRLRFLEELHPKQAAFVSDQSKRKAALCSRRAGKTVGLCAWLLEGAYETEGELSAYFALTRMSAKRLMWKELHRFNHRYSLGLTFNETELVATLPNSSEIWVSGADKSRDIEKARGSKYKRVAIDEAGSFGAHLREFIDDVLEAALMDLDGGLALAGTPTAALSGAFFDFTTKDDSPFSVHRWTMLDNTFLPHAAEWLEKRRKERKWAEDNPVYLREYRGRWVRSEDSLVYRFNRERNTYLFGLPAGHDWRFILGVDLGYDDPSAWVVLAFSPTSPNVYVVETFQESGLTLTDIADKTRGYCERYDFARIIFDQGGLGKLLVEELKRRHQLPIFAAEKTDKHAHIELMNDDFRCGRILAADGDPVCGDWEILQWDEKRKKEDSRFNNHRPDAALYAWRESRHWTHKPKDDEPEAGSDEFHRAEAERRRRELSRRIKEQNNTDWMDQ